jgi:hypothetical protein
MDLGTKKAKSDLPFINPGLSGLHKTAADPDTAISIPTVGSSDKVYTS